MNWPFWKKSKPTICLTWEVGDKAACVWKLPANDGLEVGKVYTVAAVVVHGNRVGLVLVELPTSCWCGADHPGSWLADRFRRVVPDKHEAGEECRQLLDLKRRVPVDA
jgi:hypothetical protein